jgi:hypothetical protein
VREMLARVQASGAQRAVWTEPLVQVTRLHGWLLEVEPLLDTSLVQATGERVSHETVGSRLDAWRERLAVHLTDGTLCERERECLTEFFRVISTVRLSLVQCSNRQDVPRPKNDRERSIRRLTTPDRRVSGRTNGNASL